MRSAKAMFAGGLRPDDGGDWIVAGTEWRRNPRLVIPAAYWHVIRIWNRCRSEMGAGHLPEPGGVNQQPGWLLRAFDVLDGMSAEMDKKD